MYINLTNFLKFFIQILAIRNLQKAALLKIFHPAFLVIYMCSQKRAGSIYWKPVLWCFWQKQGTWWWGCERTAPWQETVIWCPVSNNRPKLGVKTGRRPVLARLVLFSYLEAGCIPWQPSLGCLLLLLLLLLLSFPSLSALLIR